MANEATLGLAMSLFPSMFAPRNHMGQFVSTETFAGIQVMRAAGIDKPSPILQQAAGLLLTAAMAGVGLLIQIAAKKASARGI